MQNRQHIGSAESVVRAWTWPGAADHQRSCAVDNRRPDGLLLDDAFLGRSHEIYRVRSALMGMAILSGCRQEDIRQPETTV